MSTSPRPTHAPARRPRQVVGPRLKLLLQIVFGLFALLAANSLYLAGVTLAETLSGTALQDHFYQYMFLAHLSLGLILILPFLLYGIGHIANAWDRPNRRAVRMGYALFVLGLALLLSGLLLTRGLPWFEVRADVTRRALYWLHVLSPLLCVWAFVLHRLAGKAIAWRVGARIGGLGLAAALVGLAFHAQDPRQWGAEGPASGEQYFFPSLARTATGDFIPADALMQDAYCAECHQDAHERWQHSAHRFASFNNPAYRFSVRRTREQSLRRDGDVSAARFCAGCHDPVPFFSGAFDDPSFDDVNHPTSQAGITCTSCHAITNINSVRGNADYTIEQPLHYPFAASEHAALQWVNRTLVKAKPAFHKKTFLKPLHQEAEFCGACHKVHLPQELNAYRWLRGQNHYDAWLLSGVSGHGAQSFYYPDQAQSDCNGCHMPLQPSQDFAASDHDGSGERSVHDHLFASANTALSHWLNFPPPVDEAHREMLEGALRVDIFGLREEGTPAGRLLAPLRPQLPALIPGRTYLVEVVVRTLTLGHTFTQGTADSNQVWLEVTARSGRQVLGRSGAREQATQAVDPWAHFINAYVLDRHGKRVDQRNAEDIFVALYNNQIPPGASDVVHYRLRVPEDAGAQIAIEVAVQYRKFNTHYAGLVVSQMEETGASNAEPYMNDLPVTTLARDYLVLPVAPSDRDGAEKASPVANSVDDSPIPLWQRWNDYGIGLLRKSGSGELRQAEHAFGAVAELGRGDGPINLARVYLREGRLDEAVDALARAGHSDPPPPPWVVAWLTGQVNLQNGYLDEAIENFQSIVATRFASARARGFDFARDYRVWNALALSRFERAKLERGDGRRVAREGYLQGAVAAYEQALALDPENVSAHYGLARTWQALGDEAAAGYHRQAHARYKPDDNAADRVIGIARRADPAADHAANDVVIYDLHRDSGQYISTVQPE